MLKIGFRGCQWRFLFPSLKTAKVATKLVRRCVHWLPWRTTNISAKMHRYVRLGGWVLGCNALHQNSINTCKKIHTKPLRFMGQNQPLSSHTKISAAREFITWFKKDPSKRRSRSTYVNLSEMKLGSFSISRPADPGLSIPALCRLFTVAHLVAQRWCPAQSSFLHGAIALHGPGPPKLSPSHVEDTRDAGWWKLDFEPTVGCTSSWRSDWSLGWWPVLGLSPPFLDGQ